MHPLYPKYNVAIMVIPILIALPLCIGYLLIEDYGRAIASLFAAAFFVAVIIEFLAMQKYNRLVLHTFSTECDGETFAREHERFDPSKCTPAVNRAVVQSNAAVAAFERGDDEAAYFLLEEALRFADEKGKKISIPIRAMLLRNCGGYAASTGRLERAEELLQRLSALRDGLTPKQAGKWGKTVAEYVQVLSFSIRIARGDIGDEVLFFCRRQAEIAVVKRIRVSELFEVGSLHLKRGENEDAMRVFETVAREGNTLRVAREARARLEGRETDAPRREGINEVIF